jgi:DNA-directed RNA polymerase subunit RPC12/RpoP
MELQNFSKPDERYAQQENRTDAFKEFDATQLYCPRCKQAVPVRKRLLLVLPEGDKYEYLCAFCSKTVGTKIDRNVKPIKIIV